MLKENPIVDKSFDFGLLIIRLCKYMTQTQQEYILSKQLLRCGTSIGANVSEAQYAQSKADFYTKMRIALKETNETIYWLRLLFHSGHLDETRFQTAHHAANELLRLLTAICKTSEQRKQAF